MCTKQFFAGEHFLYAISLIKLKSLLQGIVMHMFYHNCILCKFLYIFENIFSFPNKINLGLFEIVVFVLDRN